MMKQILTCLVVFVMISCSAFAQDPVTHGNREYAGFSIETYDDALIDARDQDPVSSDVNDDNPKIVSSTSQTGARNMDNGVHKRLANSWVRCFSNEYKGTYAVEADTPEKIIIVPDSNGDFDGRFVSTASVSSEVQGNFDCRISIHESRTSGTITAYKKNGSGSRGPDAWATSFIPWRDNPDGRPNQPPKLGISPTDPNQTPQPGDSVTLNLITDESYYSIDWYVKAPWDTSERGTYEEYDYGDGTSTEASFSYTIPGGSMYYGDYLITAVIYRLSDMSSYEETYTVSVSDSSSSTTTSSTSVTSTNTGYSSSYGCDYNAEYDYCTDTGTCSTRSGEFGIGMCGHRWCCCAPEGAETSSTPPSTSVTSTNTGYSSSYGCDYNAEYDYCTDTGWCSAGSGEFEIGMCGHRWCCCAP